MGGEVKPLYSARQIEARIAELAEAIAGRLPADMVIVALLRGSFVFAADLIRALYYQGARPQIDFMTLGSYGKSQESSGSVAIHRDVSEAVQGKHVLIIDDILESGRTLLFARELIESRGAESVHIAVLLEKPGKRKVEITADFRGFVAPDYFVVGYGLDAANAYRELPFIGLLGEGA